MSESSDIMKQTSCANVKKTVGADKKKQAKGGNSGTSSSIVPPKDKKQSQLKPPAKTTVAASKQAAPKVDKKLKKDGDDKDHFDEGDEEWDEDSFFSDDDFVLDDALYAAFLNRLYPSAYSKQRIDQIKKKNEKVEKVEKEAAKKPAPIAKGNKDVRDKAGKKQAPLSPIPPTPSAPRKNIAKRPRRILDLEAVEEEKEKEVSEPDEIYEEVEDVEVEEDEEDDSDYENELLELLQGKGQRFNIVFNINASEYDDEDDTDEEDETDDEDSEDFKDYTADDFNKDIELLAHFKKLTAQMKDTHPKSSTLAFLEEEANHIEKKVKKFKLKSERPERRTNMKKFRSIVSANKNRFNEKTFFEKMPLEMQNKIIQQMETINAISKIEMPYKFKLLETDIPLELKSRAIKKIEMFTHMDPGMGEYHKLKHWIETFMEIPFGKFNNLPVSIEKDGMDACREFMQNAKITLDNVAFGLDDAKMQIIQMIGTWITNPDAIGSAIAIQGPPGTGKTTLVKDGISKILGREFAFIALGGATDSSFLEGHSYTYEGSKWGKIVDILVQCKSMNPIIYFDELDKISDTPRGEEIVGILTHLTDTTQNSNFHDKYFSEIDFDLSKCLFIFSYNDESKINPILKDRMYRIHTQGYDLKQKQIIAQDYLMPAIRDNIKFAPEQVVIDGDVIDYINTKHVENEKGVRNMKRCLEIIYTKLNLYRFIDSDSAFFNSQGTEVESENKKKKKIEFPLTLTKEIVDKLLDRTQTQDHFHHLYM